MENYAANKSTLGLTGEQLANGTPSDRRLILKSFYKDERCTISPTKDINGRYLGINMNIPEIKKLEMGYVPTIESSIKLYDGIEIDLNNPQWAKDWEWMQHCVEIADDFSTGQASPGAYFYIFRAGFESAKGVNDAERKHKLEGYIFSDSRENLYNRASILGVDMTDSAESDVKAFLLGLVLTEPHKIEKVYQSRTFALELLFMHAKEKSVITNKGGVYVFGEILLGVEDRAVINFFANPNNVATTRAIESMTYGSKKAKNPLEDEVRSGEDEFDTHLQADSILSKNALDEEHVDSDSTALDTEDVADNTEEQKVLSPQEKAAATRKANLEAKK